MFTKRVAAAGLAALFLSACGAELAEESAPEATGTAEQAIIWACTGGNTWTRYWYSNSSRTNEVGREDCYCEGWVYS